jgi:hypothetical protein
MRAFRLPIVAFRWLLVVVGAVLWLLVVPLVDLVRVGLSSLRRGVLRQR